MTNTRFRHRQVPQRAFGQHLIVARPTDGAPVVMSAVAALVWRQMDDWTTVSEIDGCLADAFPETPDEVRLAGRTEVFELLENDDLIERG